MPRFAFTVFALVAFAANSLLCRLALGGGSIDAATFTTARIASAAAVLLTVLAIRGKRIVASARPAWQSTAALFAYAVSFSFAYLSLSTGTGALILFGAVQTTMLLAALWSGERPHAGEWLGLLCALGGFLYLVSPGLTAPSPFGSLLMTIAGISWGLYSLWGRRATDPLTVTTINFGRAVPLALLCSLIFLEDAHASRAGTALAIASGSVASGLGYVAWYTALPHLTATRAATVQLVVPIIAAMGGLVVLSEPLTLRLAVSAVLVLGGIAVAVYSRR